MIGLRLILKGLDMTIKLGYAINKKKIALSKVMQDSTNLEIEEEEVASKSTPTGEDYTSEKANLEPKEGNPVIYKEGGKISANQLNVKPSKEESDYGGGYYQKTLYVEGEADGNDYFDLTTLAAGTDTIKILGAQIMVVEELGNKDGTVVSFKVYWYLNSSKSQQIGDETLKTVGQKTKSFFDPNRDNPNTIGDNYIQIIPLDAGDNQVVADEGKIVGLVHYVEMPDLELNS